MPPMMGGLGGGQTGERDKDLHPDRRVVHRHAANTEAVFGELEQLRKRPGRRRALRLRREVPVTTPTTTTNPAAAAALQANDAMLGLIYDWIEEAEEFCPVGTTTTT